MNLPGSFQATKKDGTIYYRSSITYKNKHISLGSYSTDEEASFAYKEASLLLSEYDNLLRIVEAEAGGEDIIGKMLVANVVLNRVEDKQFPNSINEVIFQEDNGVTQFSPISDGRFYTVTVSKETVEAVNRVLQGEDNSRGALYFAARKSANEENMKWFDEKLERLFAYGGHEFFS